MCSSPRVQPRTITWHHKFEVFGPFWEQRNLIREQRFLNAAGVTVTCFDKPPTSPSIEKYWMCLCKVWMICSQTGGDSAVAPYHVRAVHSTSTTCRCHWEWTTSSTKKEIFSELWERLERYLKRSKTVLKATLKLHTTLTLLSQAILFTGTAGFMMMLRRAPVHLYLHISVGADACMMHIVPFQPTCKQEPALHDGAFHGTNGYYTVSSICMSCITECCVVFITCWAELYPTL
jgi:hypothetical protein